MVQPRSNRVEFILPKEDVALFLRRLGDEVETGAIRIGTTCVGLEGYKEMRITLEPRGHKDESVLVTLKVKYGKAKAPSSDKGDKGDTPPPSPAPPTAPAVGKAGASPRRPAYKSLKKRIQAGFRKVQASLTAGTVPPAVVLDPFLADARLMCTYEGKGEAAYEAFLALLDRFAAAVAAGDQAEASTLAAEMDQKKTDCHARFK